MADRILPGDHDEPEAKDYGESDLGGLWGKEDPDEVEVELHSISDEEFVEYVKSQQKRK